LGLNGAVPNLLDSWAFELSLFRNSSTSALHQIRSFSNETLSMFREGSQRKSFSESFKLALTGAAPFFLLAARPLVQSLAKRLFAIFHSLMDKTKQFFATGSFSHSEDFEPLPPEVWADDPIPLYSYASQAALNTRNALLEQALELKEKGDARASVFFEEAFNRPFISAISHLFPPVLLAILLTQLRFVLSLHCGFSLLFIILFCFFLSFFLSLFSSFGSTWMFLAVVLLAYLLEDRLVLFLLREISVERFHLFLILSVCFLSSHALHPVVLVVASWQVCTFFFSSVFFRCPFVSPPLD
jgi:hypothetical protein